MKLQNDPVP